MIIRSQIEEYIQLLDFFPVLAITGPRQFGKTTIAKELMKHLNKITNPATPSLVTRKNPTSSRGAEYW